MMKDTLVVVKYNKKIIELKDPYTRVWYKDYWCFNPEFNETGSLVMTKPRGNSLELDTVLVRNPSSEIKWMAVSRSIFELFEDLERLN